MTNKYLLWFNFTLNENNFEYFSEKVNKTHKEINQIKQFIYQISNTFINGITLFTNHFTRCNIKISTDSEKLYFEVSEKLNENNFQDVDSLFKYTKIIEFDIALIHSQLIEEYCGILFIEMIRNWLTHKS